MARLRSVQSGNTVWHYNTGGSGSDCLLVLPGALGGGEAVVRTFEELGRRVLVPEYLPVSTLNEFMDGIDAVLEDAGCGRVAVYAGSFGGIIAQCWVKRNRNKVSHLILSGTSSPDPSRIRGNRLGLRLLPLLCLTMGPVRWAMRMMLRKMMKEVSRHRDLWFRDFQDRIRSLTRADLRSRYLIAIDFDHSCRPDPSELQNWSGKTLILEGGRDRVAKKEVREKLRLLYPQAQIELFPDAGHTLLLSHTDEVLRILAEFLK